MYCLRRKSVSILEVFKLLVWTVNFWTLFVLGHHPFWAKWLFERAYRIGTYKKKSHFKNWDTWNWKYFMWFYNLGQPLILSQCRQSILPFCFKYFLEAIHHAFFFPFQADLDKMQMLKPYMGALRRSYNPGLWLNYRTSRHHMSVHAKVQRIQVGCRIWCHCNLRSSLLWVCIVCQGLFVQKLRIIKILGHFI